MSGRLTSADIIDKLLGALSRTEDHSSVEIKTNAQGRVQYGVTVRTDATHRTVDEARTEAQRQFDLLAKRYAPDTLLADLEASVR